MKEILRSLRTKNNYSQSAVADYLDISRQMYNKYENGSAEPSIKNIKKLCELYKVSADLFFQTKIKENLNTDLYSYDSKKTKTLCVASPSVAYRTSPAADEKNNGLFQEVINLIPLLQLNEQISLMSKLASSIEKLSCNQSAQLQTDKITLKQKKVKKIPDAEYNLLLNIEETKKIKESSLSRIREILKNDE